MIKKLLEIDPLTLSEKNIAKLEYKQSKSQLSAEEKLVLKLHFFKKKFAIGEVSQEDLGKMLETLLDKEGTLSSTSFLFGYKKLPKDKIDTLENGKERARQNIVIDLIEYLIGEELDEVTVDKVNCTLSQEQYDKAIKHIQKDSKYFKDEQMNRMLFFKNNNKTKFTDDNSKIKCVAIINSLLGRYSIKLRKGKAKISQGVKKFEYSLSVDKQMMDIIIKKYGNQNDDTSSDEKVDDVSSDEKVADTSSNEEVADTSSDGKTNVKVDDTSSNDTSSDDTSSDETSSEETSSDEKNYKKMMRKQM